MVQRLLMSLVMLCGFPAFDKNHHVLVGSAGMPFIEKTAVFLLGGRLMRLSEGQEFLAFARLEFQSANHELHRTLLRWTTPV